MAVRFRNTFYSDNGTVWQIDILDTAFFGTITTFSGDPGGFQLSYKGLSERLDPVLGSDLSVSFNVTDSTHEQLLSDMNYAQEERFTVKLYKNTALFWSGVMLPDLAEFPDTYYPYTVDFKFTDTLARLKDLDYSNNGTPYSGRVNLLQHILNVLSKSGASALFASDIPIVKTVVNWYDVRHQYATNKDPFYYTNVDHAAFYKVNEDGTYEFKNCYDVLTTVLKTFNARILQTDGLFLIIQITEYAKQYVISRSWSNTAMLLSSRNNDPLRFTHLQPSSGVRMSGGLSKFFPSLRTVKKVYEHQPIGNYLPAGASFSALTSFLDSVPELTDDYFILSGSIREQLIGSTFTQFYTKYRIDLVLTDVNTSAKRYLSNTNGDPSVYEWSASSANYVLFTAPLWPGSSWNQVTPFTIKTPVIPWAGGCTGQLKVSVIGHYLIDGTAATIPVGSVWVYGCENFSLFEFPVKSTTTEFTATNTTNGTSPVASTKILDMGTVYIGDATDDYERSRMQTFNGTNWANSTSWGVGYSTVRKNIGQLSVEDNLYGQRFPAERFQGSFLSTVLTPGMSIAWGAKVFVPFRVSMTGQADILEGEWFNIVMPN